jgi:hypothetical protein
MFADKLAGYDRTMTGVDTPAEAFSAPSLGVTGKPTRPRWVAMLRIAAYVTIATAGLFGGGFGLFASHVGAMSTPEQQAPADAIIVLTGGEARLTAALDLLASGKGKRLLISGVNPATGRNQLRAATGSTRNLFNCCIDIDHAALDTIGNAEESAKWVRGHDPIGRVDPGHQQLPHAAQPSGDCSRQARRRGADALSPSSTGNIDNGRLD